GLIARGDHGAVVSPITAGGPVTKGADGLLDIRGEFLAVHHLGPDVDLASQVVRLSSARASSSARAIPRASAMVAAAATTFGVPTMGATAISTLRASSRVRSVLSAAAGRLSRYDDGGAPTA